MALAVRGNGYMALTLPILLAIAGVVLLLTCANVATLTLVRFVSRRREIAIRQSLGAGRVQLVRQMVLEGVVLSLCAGAVALLLTLWTAKSFARFIPPNVKSNRAERDGGRKRRHGDRGSGAPGKRAVRRVSGMAVVSSACG